MSKLSMKAFAAGGSIALLLCLAYFRQKPLPAISYGQPRSSDTTSFKEIRRCLQPLLKVQKSKVAADARASQEWRAYVDETHDRLLPLRRLPVHGYAGYGGPWIEDTAITHFSGQRHDFFPLVPLLGQWTDSLVLTASGRAQHACRDVVHAVFTDLSPKYLHFMVTQHDRGEVACAAELSAYTNILMFSAGGWGDVPIPLIKGEVTPHPRDTVQRTYVFSFVGTLTPFRKQLLAPVLQHELASDPSFLHVVTTPDWQRIASSSFFCLSPRGYGRSAFRLAELIQSGCVPIHVADDDVVWVPYLDARPLPGLPGPLWSSEGAGFALPVSHLPSLLCTLCLYLLPQEGEVRPRQPWTYIQSMGEGVPSTCLCDASEWRRTLTILRTPSAKHAPGLGAGLAVHGASVQQGMESRLPRVARDYYTYNATMRHIESMLRSFSDSPLVCRGKPASIGTRLGDGQHVMEACY